MLYFISTTERPREGERGRLPHHPLTKHFDENDNSVKKEDNFNDDKMEAFDDDEVEVEVEEIT